MCDKPDSGTPAEHSFRSSVVLLVWYFRTAYQYISGRNIGRISGGVLRVPAVHDSVETYCNQIQRTVGGMIHEGPFPKLV